MLRPACFFSTLALIAIVSVEPQDKISADSLPPFSKQPQATSVQQMAHTISSDLAGAEQPQRWIF